MMRIGYIDKVCRPYAFTLLIWTPTFEWYTTRLVVRNGHQKRHMPLLDWTMCAQKDIDLGS